MPAFLQGLKDTGFVEGRNISIEIRRADGQYDRFSLAAELLGRDVAAIVAADPRQRLPRRQRPKRSPLSS